MSIAYLLMGNIGTGKSILAHKLAMNGAIIISMDQLQSAMHGGYDHYDQSLKKVYNVIEDTMILESLHKGKDIVIDRTLMTRKTRERFISLMNGHVEKIVCYNFGKGTEASLNRRLKNPRGKSAYIWKMVHGRMTKQYEAPQHNEGIHDIIDGPKKYRSHKFDFDGTLVTNNFPKIGELMTEDIAKTHNCHDMIELIHYLWKDISNIIIIESNRTGDYECQMREFLHKHKIPYDFINENPTFDPGSRKVFAHYVYDDRNRSIYLSPPEDLPWIDYLE